MKDLGVVFARAYLNRRIGRVSGNCDFCARCDRPIVTILTCLLLMAGLPIMNWIRFFVWMAIGHIIYFSYSRKRSTLREGSGVVQS